MKLQKDHLSQLNLWSQGKPSQVPTEAKLLYFCQCEYTFIHIPLKMCDRYTHNMYIRVLGT